MTNDKISLGGPSKIVHTLFVPPEKNKAGLDEPFIEHKVSSELLFEDVRQCEMRTLCSVWKIVQYILNYGILFGVYGYGLFIGATDDGENICGDISEWLTIWCSFVIAIGGSILLLYFLRILLMATWQYPNRIRDAKDEIPIKSSGVNNSCTVTDEEWVEKLQSAKFRRLLPYFVLSGILIWQPAALVFSAYWLIDAHTHFDLVGNYGDCGNMGTWVFGIWIFSCVVCSLVLFLYLVIFFIIVGLAIAGGKESAAKSVYAVLVGDMRTFPRD